MSVLQLHKDVVDELEFEPSVNAANIGVAADAGLVTLTGHVSSFSEKLAACAAVRRVKGVQAIADEIVIRHPSDKKTADDEIARRALDILQWDTLVPSGSITLTVRDGWVALAGTVEWYFQSVAAEEDVRRLSGVHGVTNNIEIKPQAEAQDVKAKIEAALKRNAEVEAKSIRVTVIDADRVVLEGNVKHWDERFAARKAAWSAPGVRSVDDRISVIA